MGPFEVVGSRSIR